MKDVISPLLSSPIPLDLEERLERNACVSVILRGLSLNSLEIAFIQRAINPNDRWSGQIAFPGGKRELFDKSNLDAALRETREEVGIELSAQELLGRLDDIQARKAGTLLDFYIRPFVFHVDRDFELRLDFEEVADFFWVPLETIKDPQKQTRYNLTRDDESLELPAVSLNREPPLWGLTYLMVLNLIERLERAKSF